MRKSKTDEERALMAHLDDLSIEEAAEITGYTSHWLRTLQRDEYFPKTPQGRVKLSNVIRGLERHILGWKPSGRY